MSNWVQHTIPELCDWWITSPLTFWLPPQSGEQTPLSQPCTKTVLPLQRELKKVEKEIVYFHKNFTGQKQSWTFAYKTIRIKLQQKHLKILLRLLEYTYVFWNTLLLKQTRIIFINWDCPIFTLELFQIGNGLFWQYIMQSHCRY